MRLQNTWLIAEDNFEIEKQHEAERNFTIGNGLITQRGYFEEFNSGKTTKGTFLEGIRTLDSEANLPDWTALVLRLNAETVDLCNCEIMNYQRVLNLKDGVVTRTFRIATPSKKTMVLPEITKDIGLIFRAVGQVISAMLLQPKDVQLRKMRYSIIPVPC